MNEYEERIRRALATRASDVNIEPEPEELADRAARRERRRVRALSVGLVLALFAGPTLGFVVGRGDGDAPDRVAARDRNGDGVVVESHGALPELSASSGSTVFSESLGGSGAQLGAGAAPSVWSIDVIAGATTVPLARAFVRDTDGIKIRVYRAAVDQPLDAGPPWWRAPGWCYPNGVVQADVSTNEAVGIARGAVYTALRDGAVGGSLSAIGLSEGSPSWVVVAQAPAGSTRVRATFPGGAADEMEPVDGVAVLVARSSARPSSRDLAQASANVEAFGNGGASLGSGTARFGGLAERQASDGAAAPDCVAPQQLPPPGPEQPADPAAARAEIETLYGHRWDEITDEQRLSQVDDPRGLLEVYHQMETGPYAAAVKGARSILRDVVFLSKTRAAVRFDTEIPGYPPEAYDNQFGEVVIVDGHWKGTRESFCRVIRPAGVTCPPVSG
jgi:hypothetical protein